MLRVFLGVLVAVLFMVPTAIQARPAHSRYHHDRISFHYPAGWKVASHSKAVSIVSPFTGQQRHINLSAAAAAARQKGGNTEVAVLAVVSLDHKLRTKARTHRATFLAHFVAALKQGNGIRSLRQGRGRFGGRPGRWLDAVQTTEGGTLHDRFFVSLSRNAMAMYLGVLMASPAGKWAADRAALLGIASSARFN